MRQTIYINPDRYPDEHKYVMAVKASLPPGTSWAGVMLTIIQAAMQGGADSGIAGKLDKVLAILQSGSKLTLATTYEAVADLSPVNDDISDDAFNMEGFA